MRNGIVRQFLFLAAIILLSKESVAFMLTPADEQGLKSAKESCAALDDLGGDNFCIDAGEKLITEGNSKRVTSTNFHYLTNLYSLKFANCILFILSFISNSPQSVWTAQTLRSQQETYPHNVPTIAFLFFI